MNEQEKQWAREAIIRDLEARCEEILNIPGAKERSIVVKPGTRFCGSVDLAIGDKSVSCAGVFRYVKPLTEAEKTALEEARKLHRIYASHDTGLSCDDFALAQKYLIKGTKRLRQQIAREKRQENKMLKKALKTCYASPNHPGAFLTKRWYTPILKAFKVATWIGVGYAVWSAGNVLNIIRGLL